MAEKEHLVVSSFHGTDTWMTWYLDDCSCH